MAAAGWICRRDVFQAAATITTAHIRVCRICWQAASKTDRQQSPAMVNRLWIVASNILELALVPAVSPDDDLDGGTKPNPSSGSPPWLVGLGPLTPAISHRPSSGWSPGVGRCLPGCTRFLDAVLWDLSASWLPAVSSLGYRVVSPCPLVHAICVISAFSA